MDTDTDTLALAPTSSSHSDSPWPARAAECLSFGPRFRYTFFYDTPPPASELRQTYPAFHWLTIDNQLVYFSFYADKGPLNVGCLYRFCLHLHGLLEDQSLASKTIVLYSSSESDKKANAVLLAALYAMIVLRWPIADAIHPLTDLELQPFRDAGYARADFHLSVQDVLFGVRKALDHRLLRLDEFDVRAYEWAERVENGDWNYITPNILAFASPVQVNPETPPVIDKLPQPFRNVLDHFTKNNVMLVIRLNKKLYDEKIFVENGIEHIEMYFDDGTNPSMDMCRQFIDHSERIISKGGAIAVHCKAGLGRTGTLIGAYLIYKYGFTANEAIGFMRIMRPGSCVGPQQHFLYENQNVWVKWSALDSAKPLIPPSDSSIPIPPSEMPLTPPFEQEAGSSTTPPLHHSLHHHHHNHHHQSVPPDSCKTPERASTPHRAPPNSVVPGQPRKTPGTKGRYMVAPPEGHSSGGGGGYSPVKSRTLQRSTSSEIDVEMKDADENDSEDEEENGVDEVDLLINPADSVDGTVDVSTPTRLTPPTPKKSSSPHAKPLPTTATTRITRAKTEKRQDPSSRPVTRGKPLTAVNRLDNVESTTIPPSTTARNRVHHHHHRTLSANTASSTDASESGLPRSKGVVQNLGTLFESMANENEKKTGRYNLRTGASASRSISHGNVTAGSNKSRNTTTNTNSNNILGATVIPSKNTWDSTVSVNESNHNSTNITTTNNNNKSRLPQRVVTRRKAAHTKGTSAGEITLLSNIKMAAGDKNNIGLPLRSTRRRRSSMGATDVAA